VDRHFPRIITSDDILDTSTLRKHIVSPAHTFAHSKDIEIVAEKVEINVSLLQWIGGVEFNFSLGEGTKQVDDGGQAATARWCWVVPLESR